MGTIVRPDISKRNKYWISKHRHYELKHFCLQYPTWKRIYSENPSAAVSKIHCLPAYSISGDVTAEQAVKRALYLEQINLVERAAIEADAELHNYILKAVTEGLSYSYLKSKLDIPCGKDLYYDRYRRFFWVLSKLRD